MADGTNLAAVNHVVVLMLENRSFDHMLGYLYAGSGNVSPSGQPFEGLTGNESCPDSNGKQVGVYQITPSTPNAYFMPGADPGEGYKATNNQLWGIDNRSRAGNPGHHAGVRQGLRVHDHLGNQRQVDDRAGHHGRHDHGLLHPGGAAGDVRAGARLRGVRPLVRVGADRDDAEPRVRARGHQPGAHGRQHQDVHLPVHLRRAHQGRGQLADLRLQQAAADQGRLPGHHQRGRQPFRPVHRLPGRGRGRHAARVHLPRAELALDGQQPAPELRRGARRAAHPRHLRGAARRPRLAADAVRAHLRRARRLLRPRPAAVGRDPAGQQRRASSASASTGSASGCRRCSSRR